MQSGEALIRGGVYSVFGLLGRGRRLFERGKGRGEGAYSREGANSNKYGMFSHNLNLLITSW